jgi:hypothetical protein
MKLLSAHECTGARGSKIELTAEIAEFAESDFFSSFCGLRLFCGQTVRHSRYNQPGIGLR